MAINLQKGQKISLSKESGSTLSKIVMGLGWDAKTPKVGLIKGMFGGSKDSAIDLDASCVLFNDENKVVDIVYFGQLKSRDGSIVHTGDNRTGAGDGDDESIIVLLDKIPADIQKVVFCVTIHDADARKQNFGQVNHAYVRIVNKDSSNEVARYDLSEDASVETAMIFGEIYRHTGEWKFKAVGQGFIGGLAALAHQYGINI